MKNICVIVRGIHYDPGYNNGNYPKFIGHDYRKSIDNFFEMIINPLKRTHSVDVITATYDSKLYKGMTEAYQPIMEIKLERTKYRNRLIYHALDSIDKCYDLIIIYRFDIRLKKCITDISFNTTKFNIPFKDLDQYKEGTWDRHHRICDGFFIFPGNMLQNVKKAFKDKYDEPKTHMHTYNYLCKHIGSENIHFIINKELACNNDMFNNELYENRLH